MARSASKAHSEQDFAKAMEQINTQYGKGSIMLMDQDPEPVDVIPTGALPLDLALGIGGLPKGRVIEVFGPESSGKTTLALHAAAQAQAQGGQVAYIDAEHAVDPEWAKRLGVDTDKLALSQPDSGEEALEIADILARSNSTSLIVVDSVAALVPQAEIDGTMGDSHVGLQARLMSQGLRKITSALHNTSTTCIFINQLREKIGVVYGNPETTTGGRALKFYSSVRLDIRRIETLKDGSTPVGNRVRVKVVKNKCASPFGVAEFDIMFGGAESGISRAGALIDMGLDYGVLRKAGAWYVTVAGKVQLETVQLGQGKEKAREFLLRSPEIAAHLERAIKTAAAAGGVRPVPAAPPASGRPGDLMDGAPPVAMT